MRGRPSRASPTATATSPAWPCSPRPAAASRPCATSASSCRCTPTPARLKPGFLPSDVRDRVLLRLRGDATTQGFFAVDSFTFGMPLHRLTLEAAIGSVPGVLGVPNIRIAARGLHLPRNLEPVYRVPDNQILRLANDPRTPERGSIKVYTEGGV
jgi:hypothetical protein